MSYLGISDRKFEKTIVIFEFNIQKIVPYQKKKGKFVTKNALLGHFGL